MATAKKAKQDLTALTKKDLQQKITKLGGTFKAKDTKGKLIATITKLQPAPKPKARRGSSKEELRALFDKQGKVTPANVSAIAERLGVQKASVLTAISDLKSKRWAKGPVLKIEKKGDDFVLSV